MTVVVMATDMTDNICVKQEIFRRNMSDFRQFNLRVTNIYVNV